MQAVSNFKAYVAANNARALVPSILPPVILLLTSVALIRLRPDFGSARQVYLSVFLNLLVVASTVIWPGRIHSLLAQNGYDEQLVQKLISTNWVRTIAFLVQGISIGSGVIKQLPIK